MVAVLVLVLALVLCCTLPISVSTTASVISYLSVEEAEDQRHEDALTTNTVALQKLVH